MKLLNKISLLRMVFFKGSVLAVPNVKGNANSLVVSLTPTSTITISKNEKGLENRTFCRLTSSFSRLEMKVITFLQTYFGVKTSRQIKLHFPEISKLSTNVEQTEQRNWQVK